MLKFGFGNRFKHRTFEYIPRYYDPVKEDLSKRLKQHKKDAADENDPENMKLRIQSGLRMRYRGDANAKSQAIKQSNLRLLFIIIILFVLAYLVIQSDKFAEMLEVFSK